MTGYAPGRGELWCDGRKLLTFDMAKPADGRWTGGGAELRAAFQSPSSSAATA